jgi:two-component system, NarL family, response regulator DevR
MEKTSVLDDSPCRILVAGDNCILRSGVTSLLCGVARRAVIAEASCFQDAKQRLESRDFLAAIFHIDAGDLNSPVSYQALRAEYPHLILAVISGIDKADVILTYLGMGVNGYILGCSSQSEIECAFRTILRGAIYAPSSLVAPRDVEPDDDPNMRPLVASFRDLTERQSAVLELLSNGCSNKEIARQLELSPNTVKIHVSALLRHFSVRRRTDLTIAAARQDGSGTYRCGAPSRPTASQQLGNPA